MKAISNRYIIIRTHINGAPQESDFELKTKALAPGSDDTVVRNVYISIDPYQLNRMKNKDESQKASDFSSAITPGEVSIISYRHQRLHLVPLSILQKINVIGMNNTSSSMDFVY